MNPTPDQADARTLLPTLHTPQGTLYQGDCLAVLRETETDSVDLVFADPPFNLGKEYDAKIDDARSEADYLRWCGAWLDELLRVLKPGGSLFLFNLPKWNIQLAQHIGGRLTFRNWIAVSVKYSLPIAGRLYPAHYSLLYYTKGLRPAIFHPDRLPIECCRHCGGELRDYGGHKDKMNPAGVTLADVWTDIPPVRHAKYKHRKANALNLKLVDRVLALASDPGSLVLDPFGGTGTTYVAAELTGRRWLGCDLECGAITQRFANLDADRAYLAELHARKNRLFTEDDNQRRLKSGYTLSTKYRK